MDKHLAEKATELLENKQTKVINKPGSIKSKLFGKSKNDIAKKATVIIAAFNAEKHIEKTIDSIINQTLPFEQIELVVVDDKSTDNTADILKRYAKKHPNITVVLLNENTGTAAMPRNVGIELATSENVMFLDADDWLAEDGLSVLLSTMESDQVDFVVGRTVKVTDNGQSIHAEFVSYKERHRISPFEFPYIFYHMGPPSKIMKTSLLKENVIRFPEMKFGEDKYFLFRVLLNCEKVSIVTNPVYYVNRLSDNTDSLTRTTNVLDKRAADMKILRFVADLRLPVEQEQILVKRLIEYDLVRSCDSLVFVRSDRQGEFIDYIREALGLLSDRSYNIIELFDSPLYAVAAELARTKMDDDFKELFKWHKRNKNKQIVVMEGSAYYKVDSFEENNPNKLIEIPLLIRAKDSYVENGEYVQTFDVYGPEKSSIEYVIIRDRNRINNEVRVPLEIRGNTGEFRIDYAELNHLENSLFSIFVRYDGHRLTNIKRILENQITYKDRNFVFYTTRADNLGFALKKK